MESLLEKLKSLGVQKGADKIESIKPDKFPIQDVISGEWISTNVGNVFIVNSNYPLSIEQDSSVGRKNVELQEFFSKVNINNTNCNLSDLIFIDTETTGLSGGTGTMVFLAGLGHFSADGFKVFQFFLNSPENETAFLNQILNSIEPYQMIVTFNGSSFDLPLLKTRYKLNGLESSFLKKQHLDLLHISRKIWKLRLKSCKLHDIEEELLSLKRDEGEIPGWLIPQVYFDYLFTGDARPLKGVFYHNGMDVLSLGSLLFLIMDVLNKPEEQSRMDALDLFSIANMIEKNGLIEESANLYKLCMQNEIPNQFKTKFFHKYGLLCKKIGEIDTALELWEQSESIPSLVEIEKHFEHSIKDYQEALKWTDRGIDILKDLKVSNSDKKLWESDLNMRKIRLEKRIRKLHERTNIHE